MRAKKMRQDDGAEFISASYSTSTAAYTKNPYPIKILLYIVKSSPHFDDIFFRVGYLCSFMQLFRNKTIDYSQGGSLYGDGGQK